MGMEYAQRMLLCGNIIAKNQIHLIVLSPAAGNGRDGIMGFPFGFRKDKGICIRITAPGLQDMVCQICDSLLIRAGQTDDTHGPLHDACLHILKAIEDDLTLHGGLLHGEGIASTLEMLMAQDAAAHDGQVCITADEIVRKDGDEVQQLLEGCLIDFHRSVLRIKCNAVLVVIDIGAVLQVPGFTANGDGNDPVVLPGRMIHTACVALVLSAQLALGISRLGCRLGCGNSLGVFFRLAQVDGHIQRAVIRHSLPAHILLNPVTADVIRILRELVKPVCGRLGIFLIQSFEGAAHFSGGRSQDTHQFGIIKIPAGDIIGDDTSIHCVIRQILQDLLQRHETDFCRFKTIQLLGSKQLVYNKRLVAGLDQFPVQAILHQSGNILIDVHNKNTPLYEFFIKRC